MRVCIGPWHDVAMVRSKHLALCSAVAIVATSTVAFWLIGDQSTVGAASRPDYVWRVRVSEGLVRAAGVAASIVLIAALLVLRRDRAERRVVHLTVALMAVGIFIAYGARMLTAGVIGANIGAGMFIMLGLPLAAFAVWLAVASFRRAGRAPGR